MQMKPSVLTEGRIGPTLLRFAIPFLTSSLLQALYGAVDLFVVGQYDSSAAVSAVSIGSQLMHTITGIVLGISTGGTVLIGRAVGERNSEKAAHAVGTLVSLFACIAVLLTPVMMLSARGLTLLLETPPQAVEDAYAYILICSAGIPFIVGYNAVSGIFRGIGDSKTPMYFVAAACVINVLLDFWLVGGLGMGAAGAAIATIVAQGGSLVLSLVFIWRKGFPFPFERRHLRPDGSSARSILLVGSPIALQDALVNVSFLVIMTIINMVGLVASAAVGVVDKIIVFAMLPPSAFSCAVASMTAQNLGAGKPRRAAGALWYGMGFSLVFGVMFCLYAQVWPETMTALFSKDAVVIEAAAEYLRAFSLDCILVSFIFNMNSYFSGCGRSIVSFVHSMIATFCVRIPMSYLMSGLFGGSLYQIGLAAPAASLVSVAICALYFRSMRKREPLWAD